MYRISNGFIIILHAWTLYHYKVLLSYLLFIPCSGSQVTIKVQLEREDEDIVPDVIAPFFPLVCVKCLHKCIVYLCVQRLDK